MKHLTDNELDRLTELTNEMLPYDSVEIELMKHIGVCKACYDKFCGLLAVMETTDEAGYATVAQALDLNAEALEGVTVKSKVIAAIQVAKKQIKNALAVTLEQIDQATSELFFEPVFAATRGVGSQQSTVYKLEAIENDQTYVLFDAQEHTLRIQIAPEGLDTDHLSICIIYPDERSVIVPFEVCNGLIVAFCDQVEDDFVIQISVT